MTEIITKSEQETMEFAKHIASNAKVGDVIVLSGELGVGKTKFTEGFLSYFNLQNEISSPTFTIVNEYKKDDINIYHFDVYRLSDVSEFYAIGGEEYFSKGICIIEWGELILDALPEKHIKIEILKDSIEESKRIIKITENLRVSVIFYNFPHSIKQKSWRQVIWTNKKE